MACPRYFLLFNIPVVALGTVFVVTHDAKI